MAQLAGWLIRLTPWQGASSMMGTTALTVFGVIATIAAIYYRQSARRARLSIDNLRAEHTAIVGAWEAELVKVQGVSHNFLHACRLLSIHRNGRVNLFTFSRSDEIFTIETMGLLSDDPDEWRRLAGL